jgi:hypothetical protein
MNPFVPTLPRAALATALALSLASCDASDSRTPAAPRSEARVAALDAPALDRAALVDELASTLQACSYDGAPVRVAEVGSELPSDCRDMVAQIMKFTGLPQNFQVVEAPVPNAAAVILLDEQKIPQRVIAFNKDFMDIVREATGGNAWAPVSIMAHEIGHHLSGHTITPGGSQPPTELEADKFSGFVLYKMGASLADAQTAMSRLVPDGPDGDTHPGRGRRLDAIRDGWQLACEQQGDDCNLGRIAQSRAPTSPAPTPPASRDTASPAPRLPVSPAPEAPLVAKALAPTADVLPAPGSTPSKFDRFIYDEYGVLDPTWRAQFEKQMFDHAKAHGVEIVTMLVKDLRALDAQAYAQAMMRQLRIGKLDVGNGALLVIAPDAGQTGLALGPGVALQMEGHDKQDSLDRWLATGWPECRRKQACGNWTENFMLAADHIRRDTDDIEWTIRYPGLGDLMTAYNRYNDARRESGGGFDPKQDPAYNKIARVRGEIVALDVKPGYAAAHVNEISARNRKAIHVSTPEGLNVMLYVDPHTEALMPGGALRAGQRYDFVARVANLSWNPKDTQSFDLLSYDLAGG